MEIVTKVICVEMIKPSSPTPKSLQKHQLSIIDQSVPPMYMHIVYFYQTNPNTPNSEKSNQLKKSLSEILSRFYPLAGRHVGNLYVDCNDAGAPFVEAEADCDLSHAILDTNPELLNKFYPYKIDELQDFCMAVQATYFRCGGLAVGILVSHKIGDAVSFISFVNAWSAAARDGGGDGVLLPKFDAAAYFPPLLDTSVLNPTAGMTKEEITTRIFRFPAATISLLRERYSGGGLRPSRVEALSAFIWTRFVSALGYDPDKIYLINHPVDIRSRADPPLSKYHFGNIVGVSVAMLEAGDGGVEIVQKIRSGVKSVKSNFVAEFDMSEEEYMEKFVWLSFSSLLGSSLYETDFGWGKPVWVGLAKCPMSNHASLFEIQSGGGIETYITLTKQDMEKFESHLKLQLLNSNL